MRKETDEQKLLVAYLRILETQKKIIFFFAPMNEDTLAFVDRGVAFRIEQKHKTLGKRAGVSDIVVILKNKVLFIELKRAPTITKTGKRSKRGIRVSEKQKEFLEKINTSDVCVGKVCYGFLEAKDFIDSFIDRG